MHPLLWQILAQSERLLFYRSPLRICSKAGHSQLVQLQAVWNALDAECASVERIRTQFIQSTDVVSLVDYGSGSGFNPSSGNEPISRNRSVSEIVKSAAAPEIWGRLLMAHIRAVKPKVLLELGTNLGIGAHFIALAKDTSATLISIEGDPTLSNLAANHLTSFSNIDLRVGRFSDVLPTVLSGNSSIDWAYIDGHHDGNATIQYFEQLKLSVSSGCWMFFDDIRWSEAMFQAWKVIKVDSSVAFSIDLGKMGLIQLR